MRRVLISATVMVVTLTGTLAMAVPAQAHRNSCHDQFFCPSDRHTYIWYGDAFGPISSPYGYSGHGGYGYGQGYDPYGYLANDPFAYYTGYDPYGFYGWDPYMAYDPYAGYGWSPWNGWGHGGWGGWGGYGRGSHGGYGFSPQWYRYSWNCADANNARGDEAYVAYWGGREYRCDPAY